MAKLIFVIGATASGKTHFIEQNYVGKDVDVLNVYDYQQRVYAEEGYTESIPFGVQFRCLMRANQLLLDDIVKKLKQGMDVVVEHTLFKAKRRIAYMDVIRKIPDIIVDVYVMNPSEAQWKSNIEKRKLLNRYQSIKRMVEDIEFPNVVEGFDSIYEVVDGDVSLKMDAPKTRIVDLARAELTKEAETIRLEDEKKEKRLALIKSMDERKFWHYCEVCNKKEYVTADEAYKDGWDYPPKMGNFGLLGPRTCGTCSLGDTLFWKISTSGGIPIVIEEYLSEEERITWHRIKGEPESLLEEEEHR